MKLIGKLLRFYTICCMINLFFIWIDTKFTFDSPVMGYGILITIFLWAPINTIFIVLIHILRINTKILGNIFYEIIVVIFPLILNAIYFYIAYRLVDNYFVMSPDGKVLSRKWFLDFGNVDIMIYALLLILLTIHGQMRSRRSFGDGAKMIRSKYRKSLLCNKSNKEEPHEIEENYGNECY